jgi:hypothetical protein
MELQDVLTALGIGEDADPVVAIKNMQARIASLEETIAGDKPTADAAEMSKIRNDLADTQRRLLTIESEHAAKIRQIEGERRKEQAHAKVETLIAKGRIAPVMRDTALNLAETMTPDKFDEFVATLPSIDLTERGVATGQELAELEPTPGEIAIAKQMGIWNEKDPNSSRMELMRTKAKAKGLTLPAEVN